MARGRRRFGRVRQLASGRWQARYPGPDGRDRPAPQTFDSKGDADRWLSAADTDISRGQWVDPSAGQTTIEQWSTLWLANRPDLKVRTRELYDWLLAKYIVPKIGAVPIGKITPSLVRSWHSEISRSGSPTPVRQSYSLLRAMLSTAVADEVILRNPCVIKGAGVSRAAERPVATIAQVLALADAVPARYRAFILTATWSSARWGELVALTRDRLDLLHGTMRIDRQLVELRGCRLAADTPKSPPNRPRACGRSTCRRTSYLSWSTTLRPSCLRPVLTSFRTRRACRSNAVRFGACGYERGQGRA